MPPTMKVNVCHKPNLGVQQLFALRKRRTMMLLESYTRQLQYLLKYVAWQMEFADSWNTSLGAKTLLFKPTMIIGSVEPCQTRQSGFELWSTRRILIQCSGSCMRRGLCRGMRLICLDQTTGKLGHFRVISSDIIGLYHNCFTQVKARLMRWIVIASPDPSIEA